MRLRVLFRVALLTAIGNLILASGPPKERVSAEGTYSVCEVLRNLEDLNNKVVRIRDAVVSGPHGSFLSGTCTSPIVTKGFQWPDIIWLQSPRDSKGPFGAEKKAHDQVRQQIRQLRLRPKDRLILTYVGILETKNLSESVDYRAGKWVHFGFGPNSDAPAQLTVKTVMDPDVRRHKE